MRMNRQELVRFFVLREVSDDYEEPKHIGANVASRAGICGLAVSAEDIREGLIALVQSGLAKAYLLSGREPFVTEIEGLPPSDSFLPSSNDFPDYYFLITDKGREALSAWADQWPLDEEDELLPGWSPPSE